MSETPEHRTKTGAQARVNRIRAFQDELEQVEKDGVVALTDAQRAALGAYHAGVVDDLATRFDIDATDTERQMSWGMRIASTLGGLSLAVAAYFFFHRIWGLFGTPSQLVILTAAPLLGIVAMELVRRRERTLYFTGLLGVLTLAFFVLDIYVIGQIFNVTPSHNAFLLWAALGLVLAYTHGFALVLSLGILAGMAYLDASVGTWSGCYWIYVGHRPENFLLSGALCFALPLIVPHPRYTTFPRVYRLLGMLAVFIPILVLANWGRVSYLRVTPDAVEILYQLLGFLLGGLAVWLGIRLGWREVTHTGVTFLVIFLYTKFFDWWWDLMPKYLFFFIVGLIGVGLLWLLRLFRARLQGETAA